MDYKSVTEINDIVKNILESNIVLSDIYLKGEISNIKYHSRGHIYFSLKDENSKINAVFFNANGKLLFEIGFDQKESVTKLFEEEEYINVYSKKDLAGLDRIVSGEKKGE